MEATVSGVNRVPIRWRLAAVMADRGIDNQSLHAMTNLALGTISKLRNNKPARVDMTTLELLCSSLDCTPGDLMEYQSEDQLIERAIAHHAKQEGAQQPSKTASSVEEINGDYFVALRNTYELLSVYRFTSRLQRLNEEDWPQGIK